MVGKTRKNRCLSSAEMDMLLDYADGTTPLKMRTTILIHILAGTGLKVYEVIELMVDDISTSIGYLSAGRGKKRRDLSMDNRTTPLIREYLFSRRAWLNPQCANLLISSRGMPLSRFGVFRLVQNVGKNLGLECLTPELIRRSFIVHLCEKESTAIVLACAGIDAGTLRSLDMPE